MSHRGYLLCLLLAALMAAQAALGLLFPSGYRDAEWIRATWWGNDWITLLVAAPLLAAASRAAVAGSLRARLLTLGLLGYGVYNYSFYLFGAALNVFFPLYVVPFVLSVATLVIEASRLDARDTASRFPARTPVRIVGGYLLFVAAGLAAVWVGMWAAYAFWGRPTPVEPEAFKVVASLDLGLMVPALALGGTLLWRKHPWGYVMAAIAGVQGGLYLVVLCVNSAIAISRGLAAAPGELPIWGPLGFGTAAATTLLFAHAGRRDGRDGSPRP